MQHRIASDLIENHQHKAAQDGENDAMHTATQKTNFYLQSLVLILGI